MYVVAYIRIYVQCIYYVYYLNVFVVIDALSVYLTGPSTPPGGGTSTDLSVGVNLYLESGETKPAWIQVVTHLATHAHNQRVLKVINWMYR